jgi:hypothetical protein
VNREELAHILRAASRIADATDVLVIGSQSILGSYSEDDLPEEAWMSREADIAFFDDPDEVKSSAVDGAIGEGSNFETAFGVYGQGVSISTADLPDGWRDRLVPYDREDALPSRAMCLDAHDLVVAKLVADRDKGIRFAKALVGAELVSCATLRERAELLPLVRGRRRAVVQCIDRMDPDRTKPG